MKTNLKFTAACLAFLALVSCAGFGITTPYGNIESSKGVIVIVPNQRPVVIPIRDEK